MASCDWSRSGLELHRRPVAALGLVAECAPRELGFLEWLAVLAGLPGRPLGCSADSAAQIRLGALCAHRR